MAARLLAGLRPWACRGVARDQLITLTEGVIVHEERERAGRRSSDDAGRDLLRPPPDRAADRDRALRRRAGCGSALSWPLLDGERVTGLGARHGLDFDQRGRCVQLGADRRYTGPTARPSSSSRAGSRRATTRPCPGCSPRPAGPPGSRPPGPGVEVDLSGDAASLSVRAAAGPLRLHLFTGPTPGGAAARLPPRDRPSRADARVGLRPLEEPRRLRAPGRRRGRLARLPRQRTSPRRDRDRLPLGDAVQHLALQPPPVPRRARAGQGDAGGRRSDGRLGDALGQPRVDRRPAPARRRVRAAPPRAGRQLRGGRRGRATTSRAANGEPYVGRWWMGTGSIVDFTSAARAATGGASCRATCFELGVEGVKADDGEGYYFPPDARLADGRTGAEAAWEYGAALPRDDPGGARRRPRRGPRRGLRPLRLDRAAGDRDALGRRPGLGLLVAAGPAHLAADLRRDRLLQPLPRRRRLPRPAPRRALRAGAARPLGAARRAHAR